MMFEIILCDFQPEAFVVEADDEMVALKKTVAWAKDKYPGIFNPVDGLLQEGFPLIGRVETWH